MRVRLALLASAAAASVALGAAAASWAPGGVVGEEPPRVAAPATASPVRGEVLAAMATPIVTPTATVAVWPTIAPPTNVPVAPQPPPARQAAPPLPHAPVTGDASGVRFWSHGDSTSYFMSVWLTSFLTQRGAIATQPAPEYRVSSGLLTPQRFDWPAHIAADLPARDPNVVIFMIGANDAHVGMGLGDYARRVGAMMDQMQAPGRRVLWVGQPNMGRADLAASIPAVNAIFAAEAASRPWVTYVDVWAATSDANGAYTAYLPDETGTLIRARGDDGVHFTSAGGRVLALAVLRAFDALP